VGVVQPLERPHPDKDAVQTGAEEGDGWIQETVKVQGVDMFGRAGRSGKRQVPLQQPANIVDPRIVDGDDQGHRPI